QRPAAGGRILAEPEDAGWYVPTDRSRQLPAPPRGQRLIGLVALLAVYCQRVHGRLLRRSLQNRQDRVQPFPPDESGWPPVNQPHFDRLRSDPAHLLTCLRVRAVPGEHRSPYETSPGPSGAPDGAPEDPSLRRLPRGRQAAALSSNV